MVGIDDHLDVPADVQDAHARQVARRSIRLRSRRARHHDPGPGLRPYAFGRRTIRLSPTWTLTGRLRLDAIARYLQDVAIDDVQETGWGMPEHLWFVRRIRVDVVRPFLDDREDPVDDVVQRRRFARCGQGGWSVAGEAGGGREVDSDLDPPRRPRESRTDRGLRRLRRKRPGTPGVDQARAAGSAAWNNGPAVAAACDRRLTSTTT